MKAPLLLYLLQAIGIAGTIMGDHRAQETGLMVSAKTALLSKLQHIDGLDSLSMFLAEWIGFCALTLVGILFYSLALKSPQDKKQAMLGIALGAGLCVASIFWPLVL